MTTRYRNNEKLGQSLGLQPGECYDQEEECHTCISHHEYRGRKFEVYYDEMASAFSQWKAFCMGIGTRSQMVRENAIAAIKLAIDKQLDAA